jgi:hypothetical protein
MDESEIDIVTHSRTGYPESKYAGIGTLVKPSGRKTIAVCAADHIEIKQLAEEHDISLPTVISLLLEFHRLKTRSN